jgi:predicted GNAT family acetyltransferase
MEQVIYELTEVQCGITARGSFRRAGEDDKEILGAWTEEFHRDVFGAEPPEGIRREACARVDRGKTYLWCDGKPVSTCGATRPTDHGIAISFVYTPPDQRGMGYATACVASLCEELLGRGYRFCVLYADAANPTSNEIYRRIGFKEAGDSVEVWFEV